MQYCGFGSTRPGLHAKMFVSKILEVVSRPEFAQDHISGLRSDRGPLVLCDFSMRFCASTHNTKPGKKSARPLFLEDENIFQKSARVVLFRIVVELQPRDTIFGKCSHLREKGGVLMLLKKTLNLLANLQYTL